MPYTWPIVYGVSEGSPITSAQQNALANAFNQRLLSGLGDPTWRMWWKAYALTREFQQPQGTLSPAQDEWLEYFMHAAPEDGATTGLLNFNAPLPGFVHGNEELNRDAEDVRLNELITSGSTDPVSQWEQGKAQRGAYDPVSGNAGAPALDAAEYASATGWSYGQPSKILSVWGGYLMGPQAADCGGYTGEEWVFIKLRLGFEDRTFNSCGQSVTVVNASDHYAVYVTAGAGTVLHRLFYSDYLFVPTRPSVEASHAPGWQMHEGFNAFASSFRGSDAQRAEDKFTISTVGFDFEKFFTRQYLLAPVRGMMEETFFGSGVLALVSDYHQLTFDATGAELPRLTKAVDALSAVSYDFGGAFCFAGYKVTASGLTAPVPIRLQHVGGPELLESPTVTVQNGTRVYWFDAPETGTLELVSQDVIPLGALINFELAPLLARKPRLIDAYVVTRRGSCKEDAPDRGGWDHASAKSMGDNYFACGCIVNAQSCAIVNEPDIQDNPVYEATRRMLRENLRLLKRESFQSYEVVSGKAVLRFGRTVGTSPALDAWSGFAPPLTPISSGSLLSGMEYRVQGALGSVVYGGSTYAIGDTFTARPGIRIYASTGDAGPHQINGIVTGAPESGQTNEWTLFMGFTTYDGGAFQIEDYSDPLGMLVSRCSLFTFGMTGSNGGFSETIGAMADAPPNEVIQPKLPSGWTYAENANALGSNAFFASCKIYQPDYVVERVEYDEAGLVKVTLSGPLRTPVGAERQDANGLTDYLNYIDAGLACPKRVGDQASDATSEITNGSCVPRFYFTRQMPRVYVDTPADNDTQEDEDTRCLAARMQWMDWTIDAMAPGYLDRRLHNVSGGGCAPRFVNYTKDTLFHHATFTRWQSLIDITQRPDNAQSFGALPNTVMRASKYNALGSALNLLTILPVMVPTPLEYEATTTYEMTTDGVTTLGGTVWIILAANATPGGGLIDTQHRGWLSTPVASGVFFSISTDGLGVRNLLIVKRQSKFRISSLASVSNAFSPILQQLMAEGQSFLALNTTTLITHSESVAELPLPCAGLFPWDPAAPRPRGRNSVTYECQEVPTPTDYFSGNAEVLVDLPIHPGGIVAKNHVSTFAGCDHPVVADRYVVATGISRVTVPLA